jgi:hypothetical protein
MAGTMPGHWKPEIWEKGLATEAATPTETAAATKAATAAGTIAAGTAWAATRTTGTTCARSARTGLHDLRLAGEQTFALQLLARQLAGPADRLGALACALFGGLLIMPAKLHFAENTLALHLLLQRLEGLIDVVVTNENLHAVLSPSK